MILPLNTATIVVIPTGGAAVNYNASKNGGAPNLIGGTPIAQNANFALLNLTAGDTDTPGPLTVFCTDVGSVFLGGATFWVGNPAQGSVVQ